MQNGYCGNSSRMSKRSRDDELLFALKFCNKNKNNDNNKKKDVKTKFKSTHLLVVSPTNKCSQSQVWSHRSVMYDSQRKILCCVGGIRCYETGQRPTVVDTISERQL